MNTTIAISTKTRDEIKEFGIKGETYDEILDRLLRSAKDRQLQELLMDTTDTTPVRRALRKAKRKWQ